MSGYYRTLLAQLDPDYVAVLQMAISLGYALPSSRVRRMQNKLVLALKSSGIWSRLDILYIFLSDSDASFTTLNWKNPSTHQATLFGGLTFETNAGFTGNGTNAYINTNWNPTLHGVNYKLNDAAAFAYTNNNINRNSDLLFGGQLSGSASDLRIYANPSNLANNYNGRLNSLNDLPTPNANSIGHYLISRPDAAQVNTFKNLTPTNFMNVSTDLPNLDVLLLRQLSTYSLRNIQYFGAGAALGAENTDLYNALTDYRASL